MTAFARRAYRGVRRRWRMLRNRGDRVQCPICGARFRRFGADWNRPNAICFSCGAHERHRALALYLDARPELLGDARDLLHFSPEYSLQLVIPQRVGPGYVTSEYEPGRADLTLDLTCLDLADASFDATICSHVLEHVPDDAAAMRELRRILRPDGWVIVMVPIDHHRAETYEDPSLTSPAERERAYWQSDHVRLYAPDIADRLAAAGFEVTPSVPAREFGLEAALRHGLIEEDVVYLCRAT